MSIDQLEAAYAAPAADIGPTSPRSELLNAAELLRRQDDYLKGQLCLWLVDTALIHGPDETGRHCERDADTWPCHDVQAAQKVALAVRLTTPAAADA
ncbi:hypothetical protein [Streptomyces pseudovenezuelae]|uniref:hypothetical protein n=1 Tax=Streptomyces pseudovenezuelae TaxID=67350 RepID=UPI002E808F8F|nr:hypothetical protein [Streptomyces pseudovenezuelae]WUA94520.1 hypothetical protein OHO81_44915 [Streptomyces pseudovenezuelae]